MPAVGTLPLLGAGGEPVDLWRTIHSHGLARLPPMRVDDSTLELVLPVAGAPPRVVRVAESAGAAVVEVDGRMPSSTVRAGLLGTVRWVLRLDEDLSAFYERAAADPALAWVGSGAGRMVRSPTVFEDLVKTLCTLNCAWSSTVRMVSTIVARLGQPTADGARHAFPSPGAMADAGEAFYREVARAGYRATWLHGVACAVVRGDLDVEGLSDQAVADEDVQSRLLALPGIGPYAAAHMMMLLGRYAHPILDSWTRPTYARTVGAAVSDAAIRRRFAPYGQYAGLAFWLACTKHWDEARPAAVAQS